MVIDDVDVVRDAKEDLAAVNGAVREFVEELRLIGLIEVARDLANFGGIFGRSRGGLTVESFAGGIVFAVHVQGPAVEIADVGEGECQISVEALGFAEASEDGLFGDVGAVTDDLSPLEFVGEIEIISYELFFVTAILKTNFDGMKDCAQTGKGPAPAVVVNLRGLCVAPEGKFPGPQEGKPNINAGHHHFIGAVSIVFRETIDIGEIAPFDELSDLFWCEQVHDLLHTHAVVDVAE